MKPIDRSEVLGLADYETIRARFRAGVIEQKKRRRVALGPSASVLFENRDTVLLQIQEMLRTERIVRPAAVEHEIATYNESLPGRDELGCTVMIDIEDPPERDAFLRSAIGFESHVWLLIDGQRIQARSVGSAGDEPDRTIAVHYLKFALPASIASGLRNEPGDQAPRVQVAIEVDHPAYRARTDLPAATIRELVQDLLTD